MWPGIGWLLLFVVVSLAGCAAIGALWQRLQEARR